MPVERLIDFSGGENTFDAPEDLERNQAQKLENVRLLPTGGLKKRLGHEAQLATALTGSTNGVRGLHRFYFGTSIQTLVAYDDTLTAFDSDWSSVASQGSFTADSWFDFETWRSNVFCVTASHSLFAYDGSTFTSLTSSNSAPDDAKCVTQYMERLWLGVGSQLLFSGLGDETSWDETNDVFEVGENDGSDIERIAVPFGNYIMIWKDMSTWMLFGETTDSFGVRPMFENLGIAAPGTLGVTDNLAIWVSHRGVHLFDGERLHDIGEPIQDQLESALSSATKRRLMAGGIHNFLYWLSFATEDSTTNDRTLVFDLRRQAWVRDSRAFQVFASASGPGDDNALYAGDISAGQVYKLETGNDDDDSDIAWTVTTRKVDFGEHQAVKQLQRVRRDFDPPSGAAVTTSWDVGGNTGNNTSKVFTVPATTKGTLAEFTVTAEDSLDWSDTVIRGVIAEAVFERSALLG